MDEFPRAPADSLTANPYTWDYEFALPSPDDVANPTVQTVSYVITNENEIQYIDISSRKVRQDKPSVGKLYGYHIKSYKVGNGPVQPVDSTFSNSDTGLTDVRIDEKNRLVLPISAKELLDRGTNRYWYDLEDGSDWHPADWEDETESDPIDLSRMDYRTDDILQARNAFQMSTHTLRSLQTMMMTIRFSESSRTTLTRRSPVLSSRTTPGATLLPARCSGRRTVMPSSSSAS